MAKLTEKQANILRQMQAGETLTETRTLYGYKSYWINNKVADGRSVMALLNRRFILRLPRTGSAFKDEYTLTETGRAAIMADASAAAQPATVNAEAWTPAEIADDDAWVERLDPTASADAVTEADVNPYDELTMDEINAASIAGLDGHRYDLIRDLQRGYNAEIAALTRERDALKAATANLMNMNEVTELVVSGHYIYLTIDNDVDILPQAQPAAAPDNGSA